MNWEPKNPTPCLNTNHSCTPTPHTHCAHSCTDWPRKNTPGTALRNPDHRKWLHGGVRVSWRPVLMKSGFAVYQSLPPLDVSSGARKHGEPLTVCCQRWDLEKQPSKHMIPVLINWNVFRQTVWTNVIPAQRLYVFITVNINKSFTAIDIIITCRNWHGCLQRNTKRMCKNLTTPPPKWLIVCCRHGCQPSARGFGQYWGLKSCRPINTLCAPVSATSSQLLDLLLPARGLAQGFPFSTPCLSSQMLTHPLLLLSFPIFPPTHRLFVSLSLNRSPHLLLFASCTFSLDRMS